MLEGVKLIKNYFIYKDETLEQRAERLKTEEMFKEWQKDIIKKFRWGGKKKNKIRSL